MGNKKKVVVRERISDVEASHVYNITQIYIQTLDHCLILILLNITK